MPKRLIVGATVLFAVATLGQTAHAGSQAKTKLLVSYQAGSTGTADLFVVELQSSKTACTDGRKVTIYKAQPGKDKRIGAERSFAGKGDSYVAIIESNATKPGKYYASAKETSACEAAKSKKTTV